jgi:hypothetical protein
MPVMVLFFLKRMLKCFQVDQYVTAVHKLETHNIKTGILTVPSCPDFFSYNQPYPSHFEISLFSMMKRTFLPYLDKKTSQEKQLGPQSAIKR